MNPLCYQFFMINTEYNTQAYQDNFVQELKDWNDIAEGIFSLSMEQIFMLFHVGEPPVAVLAQACREALAEEQKSISSSVTPYVSQYH